MAQQAIRVSIVLSAIVASGCFLGGISLLHRRNGVITEHNASLNTPFKLEAIPQSCTLDTQMHCDPTVSPLRTLVDEDPYVRMIMASPTGPSSSESSARFLDSLFTEPAVPPKIEQASELEESIGYILEEMMASAMRLSVAAEEMTSTTYYGTRETAAEDAFVTMLSSLFGYAQASSNADNYYDPNQLRTNACAYGRTILSNQSEIQNGPIAVDADETRLRLARRLSEVETAPDFSGSGMILLTPFVTSFRIVYDDSATFSPPTSRFLSKTGDRQECLWNAFRAGEVSHSCARTMRQVQMSIDVGLQREYETLVQEFRMNVIVGLVAALIGVIGYMTLVCLEDDEYDQEEQDSAHLYGNEYYEMGDSAAYVAVPLMPLRIV